MSWQFTPYAFLYFLVAAVSLTSAWLIGQRRGRPELVNLVWFLAVIGIYGLAGGLELAVTDLDAKMLLLQAQNTATILMAVFLLFFIFGYYGQPLKRHVRVAIWSLAALVSALLWSNGWTHLIYQPLEWAPGQQNLVFYPHGPLFGLLVAFSIIVTLATLVEVGRQIIRKESKGRRQAVWMGLAILLPLLAYLYYLAGGDLLIGLNLIPVAFTMTGLLMAGAVFTDLEEQVSERTTALQNTIRDLEAEVAARQQAEAALHQAKESLVQRVADQSRKLAALYEVILVAGQFTSLASVLDQSLENILAVMGGQAAAFHQLEEGDDNLLNLAAQCRLPEKAGQAAGLPASWLETGIPRLVVDLTQAADMPAGIKLAGFHSYLGSAVLVQERPFGALSVWWDRPYRPAVEEIALFSALADQLGVIIENARLRRAGEEMAALRERRRLARDLHDSVTQSLHSLVLSADTAVYLLAQQDSQRLPALLSQVSDGASQAVRELRLLLYDLQLAPRPDINLVEALQTRLDSVERRAGVKAQLIVEEPAHWPDSWQNELYYIAIEALNNALRHSCASHVTVRLAHDAQALRLEINDDGRGFDPGQPGRGGMGLSNMRERTQRLGGWLNCRSEPGQGVYICATIPLLSSVE